MAGSTSSSLFLVRIGGRSGERRFVLRLLDNRRWLQEEPDLAAREAAALEEAERARLRAPRLVAFASEDVGFGAPAVLTTFVEGRVELRPHDGLEGWVKGLAQELASIHRHQPTGFPWRYKSWVSPGALAPPPWSARSRAWERAIELWLQGVPGGGSVFLHGDFHPVNVLWRQGRVSGAVDWINACAGPPGVDVAHCSVNLALMHGTETAQRFVEAYGQVAGGFILHPCWELDRLLDLCLPEPSFYPPWETFGLDRIPAAVLRRRAEAHLEHVLARAGER